MKPAEIALGAVANVYSRQMVFRHAGDYEQGHTHEFDHLTLLASGSLKVTVDGQVTVFKAPHMIYIHKDKMHELVALEDNTVAFCIHALRDMDGNVIDTTMIPNGVVVETME
jgi:quercetin dioxygenase-like cupin family protein